MQIISHRGYWKYDSEKNSLVSFERSFSKGFGTETDVRDFNGKLVISHDIATSNSLPLEQFFTSYKKHTVKSPLALNIKADGIRDILKALLNKYDIKNYFVFDMSVPEQIHYLRQEFNTFTRQSEYEKNPVLYEKSYGVWIDCFNKEWVTEKVIANHIKKGKYVCLVSPELHKRDPKKFWTKLSKMKIINSDKLILCTDIPEDAWRFYYGKN